MPKQYEIEFQRKKNGWIKWKLTVLLIEENIKKINCCCKFSVKKNNFVIHLDLLFYFRHILVK